MSSDIDLNVNETTHEEKKIIVSFTDFKNEEKPKRMTPRDRHEFIDWMFDNYKSFDLTKTRWNLAKEITDKFRATKNLQLSIDWVNALLKLKICKYEDGTYGFQEETSFTVEDMCQSPSAYRSIK